MPRPLVRPTILDLTVMLYNVFKAADHRQVGFEDANRTLQDLITAFSAEISADTELLESAMWSCNLLDEKDEFWHPLNHSFKEFAGKFEGQANVEFDRKYNYFKKKEN